MISRLRRSLSSSTTPLWVWFVRTALLLLVVTDLFCKAPSAEGATLAIIEVAKACWSPTSTSILKGNFHPWAFIHDEICGDVVADPEIATEVAKELERIMCECLTKVLPNVTCAADSALMIAWNKKASDVFNEDGHLVPFEVLKDEILAQQLNYVKKEK